MSQIDVMKQALEALEGYEGRRAKDILRQAIEQAEQVEPVAIFDVAVNEKIAAVRYNCATGGLRSGDKLYTNSPTAPAEIDFLQHDDHLRFIQRVLESDSPKSDRDEAAQMVRDIRRSIRPIAPAQRPLTRAEKNRIWSSCSGAATLPARASLFGSKIEAVHGIKGASL